MGGRERRLRPKHHTVLASAKKPDYASIVGNQPHRTQSTQRSFEVSALFAGFAVRIPEDVL